MLKSIAWNGKNIVIVGDNIILMSNNEETWKIQEFDNYKFTSVIWDGIQFIAIGKSGVILTSDYGDSWKKIPSPIDYNLNDIVVWPTSDSSDLYCSPIASIKDNNIELPQYNNMEEVLKSLGTVHKGVFYNERPFGVILVNESKLKRFFGCTDIKMHLESMFLAHGAEKNYNTNDTLIYKELIVGMSLLQQKVLLSAIIDRLPTDLRKIGFFNRSSSREADSLISWYNRGSRRITDLYWFWIGESVQKDKGEDEPKIIMLSDMISFTDKRRWDYCFFDYGGSGTSDYNDQNDYCILLFGAYLDVGLGTTESN